MEELAALTPLDLLIDYHGRLDAHFSTLRDQRALLDPPQPVFCLEHDLDDGDLERLRGAVRAAVRAGLGTQYRRHWLPFVVYAAELGYRYEGDHYWPVFESETPGWTCLSDPRDYIKTWFKKFTAQYGGAVPIGRWAETFKIIAWPITHAVLPTYLQRQLARLMYDYRSAWTTDLLSNPPMLGVALARRASDYSDRFQKFCQNTELLGQVVAALLSDTGEESPYLTRRTLQRVVGSLDEEQRSRTWLREARRSASTVRSKGFVRPGPPLSGVPAKAAAHRLPATTDPRCYLQRVRGNWHLFATLPDLASQEIGLPHVIEEIRTHRAQIAGARSVVSVGALLFPARPVEFNSWPWPHLPFVQLVAGDEQVNRLLADRCRISPGPWWVFRRGSGAPAVEVKGKFLRPGRRYCMVAAADVEPPALDWITPTAIGVEGVRAFEAAAPATLNTDDRRALRAVGLSVVSEVSVRPVGLVPGAWDGEGAAEWIVGDACLIAIHAEHMPDQCRLIIDGETRTIPWPSGETECYLALKELPVGAHEVTASIESAELGAPRVEGTLAITIRDPYIRPEGGAPGEGLRLRTSPPRPSLSDLWDGRAELAVDGPPGTAADFAVALIDERGQELGIVRRPVTLPLDPRGSRRVIGELRRTSEFKRHYDDAERSDVSVSRRGVGFAQLRCERGFRGLRWVLERQHDGAYQVRLIDRTDAEGTVVKFRPMEEPDQPKELEPGAPFVVPPRGGLIRATSGGESASLILPPNPNELRHLGRTRPRVRATTASVATLKVLILLHRRWAEADLPADSFAASERAQVLDAITIVVVSMIAGTKWGSMERNVARQYSEDVDLNAIQKLVGNSPGERALATEIGRNLHAWDTPGKRIVGLAELIDPIARSAGMNGNVAAARNLLLLASDPGKLLGGEGAAGVERDRFLSRVINHPVLLRAARYAVLGCVSIARDAGDEASEVGS